MSVSPIAVAPVTAGKHDRRLTHVIGDCAIECVQISIGEGLHDRAMVLLDLGS